MAIDLRGRSSVSFYDTFSAFPSTGSTTILYVDRGDMVVYIWNGSSYDQLNNGSNITTVANYSALLAIGASNVPNMFYWCSSAQGTSWLPGPLGGTYYNSGLYYSNGTSWEYMNSPYQATQLEVDAGIVADKFVTPSTFYNSSKWDSIPTDITIGTTPITSGVAGRVLFEGAGNVVQEDAGFLFDATNKTLTNYGKGGITSNTSFGLNASQSNTTGINNSFFGANAGQNNSTGTQNSFFGAGAGLLSASGSRNSFFGQAAGYSTSTGINNSFFGVNAGRFIADGTTGNSICNSSIFLGYNSKALAGSQTNQIVIGDSSTGLGSNSSVIGNSSTTLFRPYGNVAIGADTASARLDVRAQGALSTDIALRVRNSADSLSIISASGNGQFAIGLGASTAGATAVTIGGSASTGSVFSVAVGYQANTGSASDASVAVGYAASATGNRGVALGFLTSVTGSQGISLGERASVTAASGIAIGSAASVSAPLSFVVGVNATNAIGNSNAFANGLLGYSFFNDINSNYVINSAVIPVNNISYINTTKNVLYLGTAVKPASTIKNGVQIYTNYRTISQASSTVGATATGASNGKVLTFSAGANMSALTVGTRLVITNSGGLETHANIVSAVGLVVTIDTAMININTLTLNANAIAVGNTTVVIVSDFHQETRNDNGDIIKLYKQDLPTSPTNAQIATFLSNLGLANLI